MIEAIIVGALVLSALVHAVLEALSRLGTIRTAQAEWGRVIYAALVLGGMAVAFSVIVDVATGLMVFVAMGVLIGLACASYSLTARLVHHKSVHEVWAELDAQASIRKAARLAARGDRQ